MIKVVLFDVDGVLIKARVKYFSERAAEEFGYEKEKIEPFFNKEFVKCLRGKSDLKNEIVKYLPEWGWKGSVESLLKYWFDHERELDQEVVDMVRSLRKKGIKVYLSSDQEKYRAKYLLENVGLKNVVDGSFFSCDVGFQKYDKRFFKHILKTLKIIKPGEIYYWDDGQKNINTARGVGINGYLYKSFKDLQKVLN